MARRSSTKSVEAAAEVGETVTAKPRKFAQDDMIMCRSTTYGELLLPGVKSKLLYSWANFGDRTEVEFQDLQALRSTRSAYLNAPLFIIEDEDLIVQWPELGKLYANVAMVDLDKLFALSVPQFKKQLRQAPVGFRDTIKNAANSRISTGELDSLAKIRAIDEILGTDLMLLIGK